MRRKRYNIFWDESTAAWNEWQQHNAKHSQGAGHQRAHKIRIRVSANGNIFWLCNRIDIKELWKVSQTCKFQLEYFDSNQFPILVPHRIIWRCVDSHSNSNMTQNTIIFVQKFVMLRLQSSFSRRIFLSFGDCCRFVSSSCGASFACSTTLFPPAHGSVLSSSSSSSSSTRAILGVLFSMSNHC